MEIRSLALTAAAGDMLPALYCPMRSATRDISDNSAASI
jgi:hypothetical protein